LVDVDQEGELESARCTNERPFLTRATRADARREGQLEVFKSFPDFSAKWARLILIEFKLWTCFFQGVS
jgi:hypothetical protein